MLKNFFSMFVSLTFTSSLALAQGGISQIEGRWSHDLTGETMLIVPNAFGWETNLSWLGTASISRSSHAGGNIKVEGQGSRTVCFYQVSLNNSSSNNGRMTWNLVKGDQNCPHRGVYSRAQ